MPDTTSIALRRLRDTHTQGASAYKLSGHTRCAAARSRRRVPPAGLPIRSTSRILATRNPGVSRSNTPNAAIQSAHGKCASTRTCQYRDHPYRNVTAACSNQGKVGSSNHGGPDSQPAPYIATMPPTGTAASTANANACCQRDVRRWTSAAPTTTGRRAEAASRSTRTPRPFRPGASSARDRTARHLLRASEPAPRP